MIITLLLSVATPANPSPAAEAQQICKVVKDQPVKSKRLVACGTADEWRQYRASIQRLERQAVGSNVALSAATSGF